MLTIELLGFDADLDAIYVNPTAVNFPAPRVVAGAAHDDRVVVADAVVTDPQFGAVPNNAGSRQPRPDPARRSTSSASRAAARCSCRPASTPSGVPSRSRPT